MRTLALAMHQRNQSVNQCACATWPARRLSPAPPAVTGRARHARISFVSSAQLPSDELETILATIRREHPSLRSEVVDDAPVPAARFPVQPGLAFRIGISVQRDELHLTAGDHFWVAMFPASKPGVRGQFVDSVAGLMSGQHRVVESYLGGRAVAARLERQDERGDWKTTATWANFGSVLPFPRRERVLRNIVA